MSSRLLLNDRDPGASDWRSRVLEARRGPQSVSGVYSRLAPVYELWARMTEAKARSRVLELANIRDGEDILEVATGTGAQLVELARRNPSGTTRGIELAPGMVRRTQKRLAAEGLAAVEVREGSGLELPFEDESFDLLVNGYMLDLLPHEEIVAAIAEYRRVLRPGGRLVLSNMTVAERRRDGIWDELYKRGIDLTAGCRGVLAAPVLDEEGFEQVSRQYIGQMGFPTEIVTAVKPLA